MSEENQSFLPTRASLLRRLQKSPDDYGWFEFAAIYRRMLFSFCRKAGLKEHEAEDAVQETFIEVSKHLPRFNYDPRVCSFKTWLLMIARQRVARQFSKRRNPGAASSATGQEDNLQMDTLPDSREDPLAQFWEAEWQQHILNLALARLKPRVQPEQFQIFELLIAQKWVPGEIARTLGITRARVYLVKHRLGSALQREIRSIEGQGG